MWLFYLSFSIHIQRSGLLWWSGLCLGLSETFETNYHFVWRTRRNLLHGGLLEKYEKTFSARSAQRFGINICCAHGQSVQSGLSQTRNDLPTQTDPPHCHWLSVCAQTHVQAHSRLFLSNKKWFHTSQNYKFKEFSPWLEPSAAFG